MSKHYPKLRPVLECLEITESQCRFYEPVLRKKTRGYSRDLSCKHAVFLARTWLNGTKTCCSEEAMKYYMEKQK